MGVFVFLTGLVMGSFYNVVIWRLPRGASLVAPRSHCPSCHKTLGWVELLPVVSYVLQKGRCRHCGAPFSWRYPLVEFVTGVGFFVLFVLAPSYGQAVAAATLFSLLLVGAFIDSEHRLLPNAITLPGIGLGLSFSLLGWSVAPWDSVYGTVIGGGILLAIALIAPGGMGVGDAKFLAMIGSFLGWIGSVYTLFLGSVLGSICGLIYLKVTNQDRKTPIPFGPFLAIGALLARLWLWMERGS